MSFTNYLPKIEGSYREKIDLSTTNWFRVGGKAEVLFKPIDTNDLSYFLKNKPQDCPLTILGVGSNVIIRDGGVKGVVIKLGKFFNSLTVKNNSITAGTSTLDCNVAKFAAEHNLSGLEFLLGIPGSIGGAIAMNAGAYGSDTSECLVSVEAVNIKTGEIINLKKTDIGFTYRSNNLKGEYIYTKATFMLQFKSKVDILKKMNNIVETRSNTQPIKERTGGSTFKNPEGYKAWQLIDGAGCHGLKIGDAQVSKKHCNFLINTGNATAKDIESLGELVRQKVFNKTKIILEWEIKRIGER